MQPESSTATRPSQQQEPESSLADMRPRVWPHSAMIPDFRHRAQFSELMDEPCSRETMRACLRDLARVNRWFLSYRPTLDFLEHIRRHAPSGPLRILDVGCGYGDTLRRIEGWARRRKLSVELTGLDLNADTIAIAAEATAAGSRIQWVAADVFQYQPIQPPHIVVSSLFTHHLADVDVTRFLRWMEQNALLGWFVNDLSRAPVPYHLFRWFSRVAGLHPFVQHDGPVSIARAFSAEDWLRMGKAAGLHATEFAVASYAPARLCVSRSKPR